MCLTIVKPVPKNLKRFGWKLFYPVRNGNGLMNLYHEYPVNLTDWNVDTHTGTIGGYIYAKPVDRMIAYPAGFHIYQSREEARNAATPGDKIYKVEFEDVVAYGEQEGHRVIVARKYRIVGRA